MVDKVSKKASSNDLYITYYNSVVELFNSAESRDVAQFLLTLMPPPRKLSTPAGGMSYEVPNMEIEEAFETHRYLNNAVMDEQLDAKVRTRLILIVSFHFLEADRWHFILGNILNVIIGRNYVGNLFEGDSLGEKINGTRGLLKECQKKRIVLSICDVYSHICNDNIRELRNAFFHSHYTLTPEGNLLITRRLMEGHKGIKKYFKFDEIRDIHRAIVTFLTVLAIVIKETRQKFEGKVIDLDKQVDWIKSTYKPIVKQCETLHRLKGRLSYRQDNNKRWYFQGQYTNIGQS